MDMADDMDTNINMVVRLKWCVEALTRHMTGMWGSSQAALLGRFLKELAHAFWLEEDVDLYIHLANPPEQTPIQQREAIRQKLNQIDSDILPQTRNSCITQCDQIIQILSSEIPDEIESDPMGRPVILDGAARVMKKPVEITIMSNNIVLYLLMAIRANLDPSSQKAPRVSLPHVPPPWRPNTHIQSLLRQLTQV
jgi:hypothetical protein